MLLAVFSDSHGNAENMRRAVERSRPDHIIFLGDGVRDGEAVERAFPQIPVIILRGNCDWAVDGHDESVLFELDGIRIFAAHGHRHGVKMELDGFWNSVRCSGSRLGLYGHTHIPRIDREEGICLMNPGSIGDYLSHTFGLVTIKNGDFNCEIREFGEK